MGLRISSPPAVARRREGRNLTLTKIFTLLLKYFHHFLIMTSTITSAELGAVRPFFLLRCLFEKARPVHLIERAGGARAA